MEPADLGKRYDLSGANGLYRPPIGGVFAQRKVRPGSMTIIKIGSKYSSQMVFIENNDVIEILPPDRADYAFHEWVLPR